MPGLANERELGGLVMGIDEAGRGPLAGPVYAAAVHLPLDVAAAVAEGAWRDVNDSKKLNARRRDELAAVIKETPGCVWAIACATPGEIDRLNILRATHLAMHRAAQDLAGKYAAQGKGTADAAFSILVDGLPVPGLPFPSRNIVKGDGASLFIAAASILAKTARDAYCLEMDAKYPGYGFASHKGYPTAAHIDALKRLGPCPEHRRSFAYVSDQWLF